MTYADVQHMDMPHLYVLLSSSVQIRKPVDQESQPLKSLDAMHEPGRNGTIGKYKPVH